MTEKRFNLISDNNLQLYDFIEDNGKVIHTTKVVDLLNELAEENEQLKIRLNEEKEKALKFCRNIDTLTIENEQLNKKLRIYKSDGLETLEKLQRCYENSKKAMKTIDALDEENEQLKQQLTDCKEKKQQMKEFFMNSEPIIEQKKLQKLIYQTIINLIDEKINELQEKYDIGQENGSCPMYDILRSIKMLKELKKELKL